MGQSSPAPSWVRPLKSRWLSRSATAFHSIVLPPTPRLRSESNPTLPGRIVGIWRLGKSNGIACVLKSVRVLTRGPPSTMATRTPRRARCDARVPPPAPDPTMTTSKVSFCIDKGSAARRLCVRRGRRQLSWLLRTSAMGDLMTTDPFMIAAIEEAEAGLREGGIPIGSVLVHEGAIIGRGHNRRIQKGSPTLHAEIDALERAGRQRAAVLSPVGLVHDPLALRHVQRRDTPLRHTGGGHRRERDLSRGGGASQGTRDLSQVLQDPACIQLMTRFIESNPALWNEDIGV